MEGKKIRAIGTSLILCLAAMSISGCGSKEDSSSSAVVGRVTGISDTQAVLEVMDKQNDKRPEAASGGAAGIEGDKPQGTPPADKKDGRDGQKPKGTPPADVKKDDNKKGETKTYQIDSDTKVYKKSGEETSEISISEVDPGSMVSVEADDGKVTSITVSDMSAMGRPGQDSKDSNSGK